MVSALLLALALLGVQTGSPMAYTLVYSQNFAAGNSTFTQTNFYSRDGSLTHTASGPDSSYPEARYAEGVQVNASGGPSGAKTLDCWDGYHGPFQGYDAVGAHFNLPTYADRATGLVIPRGAAEVWYKPNPTSMVDNTNCPLLNLFSNTESNSTGDLSLDAYLTGGQWALRLRILVVGGQVDRDPVAMIGTTAALTNVGHTYRLEWNDGSLACAPDQYVRVLFDGAIVYEETEADGLDLHPNVKTIRGVTLGFAGLFGEATNLRIYEDPCDSAPQPEIITTTPTCCDTPTGPGDTGTNPDPVGALPPWMASCIDGGVVDSVADLADGEVW